MPFLVQRECSCCRGHLWHCEKCWDTYHNGKKDNDYIEPEHYGQPMFEDIKKFVEGLGVKIDLNIKEDKDRKYKEGEYH